MSYLTATITETAVENAWLKRYYFARATFSILWVLTAMTIGRQSSAITAVMLIGYPAWDALANYRDAARSGGLSRNFSQTFNMAVSVAVMVAVAVSLTISMNWVLAVFGIWAIFSGVLQLVNSVRRWDTISSQWSMVLSGAQSSLAGCFFISQTLMPASPSIADIAGFGAFYFLVLALSLTVKPIHERTNAIEYEPNDEQWFATF